MSVLVALRVRLPDRPGALGLVASRIGAVRGDVLGVEILEVIGTSVLDEIVVRLDTAEVLELMIDEINAVDGTSVDHVRPSTDGRADPSLSALRAAVRCAEAPGDRWAEEFCDALVGWCDAQWVVIEERNAGAIIAGRGERPVAPAPDAVLEASQEISVEMVRRGVRLHVGVTDRPIHERDRLRVTLLARLVDALVEPGAAVPDSADPVA